MSPNLRSGHSELELGDDTIKKGKRVTTVNEVGQTTASLKHKLEKQQEQLDGIEKKLECWFLGSRTSRRREAIGTRSKVYACVTAVAHLTT